MSPREEYRPGKRRLLAEEHIIYGLVLLVVIVASTLYAIKTKDHSANVWAVYVGVVTGIFGLLTGRSRNNSRRDDDRDE